MSPDYDHYYFSLICEPAVVWLYSYWALSVNCIDLFIFPITSSHTLLHSLCVSLPKLTAMLAANRFWEAEREYLSKQRMWLGVGQCTETPFWLYPNYKCSTLFCRIWYCLVFSTVWKCRKKWANKRQSSIWYDVAMKHEQQTSLTPY